MGSRRINFTNPATGHQLAGILDLPEDAEPRGRALFAHCFTCGKSLKSMRYIGRALNRQRIAVVRFDFTGLGESEGKFAETSLSSNIGDLIAAASWMEQNIGGADLLIGHSFGGAAVLQAASSIMTTKAVATIAAPYDPKHVVHLLGDALDLIQQQGYAEVNIAGRRFTIAGEFIADLAAHRTAERIRSLNRPLLVLHSPNDRIVPIDNARKIFQAAAHPKSFISLDGMNHLLTEPADAGYVGDLIACWVSRYLPAIPE